MEKEIDPSKIKGSDYKLIKKLKPFARSMRKEPTKAEEILWKAIRRKALGCRFRRQFQVDRFILDFYCYEHKLAIEVDGATHFESSQIAYDKARTEYLNSCAIKVLRFTNHEVENNLEAVLQSIIASLLSPSGEGPGMGA